MKDRFIGFGKLEDLAAAADPTQPLYASLLEVTGKADAKWHAYAMNEFVVTVQSIVPEGVQYVRLVVGREQTINGHADSAQEHARRRARCEGAMALIKAWLAERHFRVVPATVAAPPGLGLVDGWADFLDYDKDTDRYYRLDLGSADRNPVLMAQNLQVMAGQGGAQ